MRIRERPHQSGHGRTGGTAAQDHASPDRHPHQYGIHGRSDGRDRRKHRGQDNSKQGRHISRARIHGDRGEDRDDAAIHLGLALIRPDLRQHRPDLHPRLYPRHDLVIHFDARGRSQGVIFSRFDARDTRGRSHGRHFRMTRMTEGYLKCRPCEGTALIVYL